MLQLAIPIPSIRGRQDIIIEMTINNQKQKMHFLVQLYEWDDCKTSKENRIECIQELIKEIGQEWMVYHIGLPTQKYVPMTFVKTADWEQQRRLMLETIIEHDSIDNDN